MVSKGTKKRRRAENKIKKTKKGPKKLLGLAKFLNKKPKKKNKDDIDNEDDDKNPKQQQQSQQKQPQQQAKTKVIPVKKDDKKLNIIDKCKMQMSSSLLRLIDESVYSEDTRNVPLDKDKFNTYHEAYAKVCDKWPVKPIDFIVKFIKKRLISSKRPINKLKFGDIGCGKEPLLKMKLPPKAKVFSFDLVSMHKDIIEANMEKLPLDSSSLNCAVYSLSLMAKNLGYVLLESKRVLKLNGSLLIVEVTSRFGKREKKFIEKMDRIGFKLNSCKQLPPNGYFTFFHFTKLDERLDYSAGTLTIELKPCVYKAR